MIWKLRTLAMAVMILKNLPATHGFAITKPATTPQPTLEAPHPLIIYYPHLTFLTTLATTATLLHLMSFIRSTRLYHYIINIVNGQSHHRLSNIQPFLKIQNGSNKMLFPIGKLPFELNRITFTRAPLASEFRIHSRCFGTSYLTLNWNGPLNMLVDGVKTDIPLPRKIPIPCGRVAHTKNMLTPYLRRSLTSAVILLFNPAASAIELPHDMVAQDSETPTAHAPLAPTPTANWHPKMHLDDKQEDALTQPLLTPYPPEYSTTPRSTRPTAPQPTSTGTRHGYISPNIYVTSKFQRK